MKYPMIRRPTRVTKTTHTVFDHVWTNDDKFSCSGIIPNYISDHFPVFFTCRRAVQSNSQTHQLISYRNFCDENKKVFAERLNAINWTSYMTDDSVDILYNKFTEILTQNFYASFPLCYKNKKSIDINKPYVDASLKKLIAEKKRLLRLYNKYPITYGPAYRACRNKITFECRKAKKVYFSESIKRNERNPKQMWKVINEIFGRSSSKGIITELSGPNGDVNDRLGIANILNEFFSKVGENLNAEIPRTNNISYRKYLNGINRDHNRFLFTPVNEEQVVSIIKSLKNTGAGLDDIPMFIFKENASKLASIITFICNKSLTTGVYPKGLTVARITCIFKAGNRKSAGNYRPIAILPCFSKILDKIVESQLQDYLISKQLLDPNQYGFRRCRSTEHALHSVIKTIHSSFNKGMYSMGIFLDIKKAFDSLDRTILLDKLTYYGILGFEWKWFESYLTDRRQCVMHDNHKSELKRVNFGVPQGGGLSPVPNDSTTDSCNENYAYSY